MAFTTSSASPSLSDGAAYVNGKVFTVDENAPWTEAFIVSADGYFVQLGSSTHIAAIAAENGLVTYNLNGSFVMPGIHDAHVHMLLSGIAMTSHAQLPEQGLTNAKVVEQLKAGGGCACKYAHAHQDWLVANAFMVEDFDRKVLDQDFPSTPVLIRGGAGHSGFLNTEALNRSGYDIASEPDAQGTWYGRDNNGSLTGEVAEMGLSKVMTTLPQPGKAHAKRVLREAQRLLHAAGVTSCQEASANTLMMQAVQELEKENAIKLDLCTHLVYAPDWIAEERSETLWALIDQAEKYSSRHIHTRFVKIILDGVPLEPYMSHATLLSSGQVDESKLFVRNVQSAIEQYDARGYTMKIHCTGQGATRLVLDAYESVRRSHPRGPRHEIAHCSGVHADDYARFAELNVTAEMSPAFFFTHPLTQASGGLMDWNFGQMVRNKAHVTIGSDWGAGPSPDLLPHLDGVVEVIGGGDRAVGGARLCRMLTLNGAQAVGMDGASGSIEVGKKANFIAVDKDLSRGDFAGAAVTTTWFEGEIVYEKKTRQDA